MYNYAQSDYSSSSAAQGVGREQKISVGEKPASGYVTTNSQYGVFKSNSTDATITPSTKVHLYSPTKPTHEVGHNPNVGADGIVHRSYSERDTHSDDRFKNTGSYINSNYTRPQPVSIQLQKFTSWVYLQQKTHS